MTESTIAAFAPAAVFVSVSVSGLCNPATDKLFLLLLLLFLLLLSYVVRVDEKKQSLTFASTSLFVACYMLYVLQRCFTSQWFRG